jgi:hypothetical protein
MIVNLNHFHEPPTFKFSLSGNDVIILNNENHNRKSVYLVVCYRAYLNSIVYPNNLSGLALSTSISEDTMVKFMN